MRVFVTGASGHLGSAVVPELLKAGHSVVGLARSDASAAVLADWGAHVRRGDLDDLDGLREAAAASDGVVHLAFKHDLLATGDYSGAVDADLAAVRALAEGLEGSGAPFVGTSGTAMLAGLNRVGTEDDVLGSGARIDAENVLTAFAGRGVRPSVVRLPPVVHSTLDTTGFVRTLIAAARAAGRSGYLGDGANRWPSVHTLDAARLYRLALEEAPAGTRLHAVDDEGVPFRQIAEGIGRHLGLPTVSIPADEAPTHFGWLAGFVGIDNPTSAELTRERFGWVPAGPGLLDDLGSYFSG
ncbi:SDR family oxidoreductase [Actinophytocola algeriensis]|uniref:Nucleoside-diphosphate-sugar epimerase n=1 Tax=Actinophytocola algeriensis TaxID=1768010 RepID=A0A7W7VH16_9PSEU|nr:SDR family oxidoreductase [Actinophytocola algeriensis]MBB4909719.1 nucleoside-diphosphate-sugar epimerase [Actinophytocola algeriensis]MBE1475709.1 nucleoside-diphosphate-sugar epimerase [Actinophytocola algeriensis]